jgi:molybdenum cofactor cytidylyltransferase
LASDIGSDKKVGAVVLAAGLSLRMGLPKVLLPWASDRSIIEHILLQIQAAGVDEIVVVTGRAADEVRAIAERVGASAVHNPNYQTGEMLSSLKVGLQALPEHVTAALVVLGDQPRIQPETVIAVLHAYTEGQGGIIAPSYQMRRGHPILIERRYWSELLALPADGALRDLLNAHAQEIAYIVVDNDSVLNDIDTPEEYDQERRKAGLS